MHTTLAHMFQRQQDEVPNTCELSLAFECPTALRHGPAGGVESASPNLMTDNIRHGGIRNLDQVHNAG